MTTVIYDVFTSSNIYVISLAIIAGIILISYASPSFRQDVRKPLRICIIAWVICFGYKIYTGNDIVSVLTHHWRGDIETAKNVPVMNDGRELYYIKMPLELLRKTVSLNKTTRPTL